MSETNLFGLIEGIFPDPEQGPLRVWGVWHREKSNILYMSEKQMKAQARLLDFTKKRREVPPEVPEPYREAIIKTQWSS